MDIKKAIVTLADSNYFELLIELVDSINSKEESKNVNICILDAGLSQEHLKILEKKVYSIKKAEWDIEVPSYKTSNKEWLKSQVSRAFLPKYFPEFDKYLWVDCDAWVCSWESIELLFKACEKGKLGITQTMGPGYRIMSKVKWLMPHIAIIKSQNYKHAKRSGINEKDARTIAFAPHLNIGVFSLEKNSPCWSVWQRNLKITLAKGRVFGSEGLAINLAVYVDKVETEFLPLYCNWIASNLLPFYDIKKKIYVEPNLPNYKIGIMHLAAGIWVGGKDVRLNKDLKIDIRTTDGNFIKKNLRYE
ncbi:glycosyltransferase [Pelagibacteraceae bacterium]|nr:glycosyltransferase [Pelagibacteraceae bacterium]